MSRIGRMPIAIPAGVTVTVDDTNLVTVKGPKGENSYRANTAMQVKVEDGSVTVTRPNDNKENRALHGLTRTLIANMIFGVNTGFSKTLVIEGVGYRAKKDGKKLVMNLGLLASPFKGKIEEEIDKHTTPEEIDKFAKEVNG